MSFINDRLSIEVEKGVSGSLLGFKTKIVTLASGDEQRNSDWAQTRGQWDVGYGIQSRSNLADVIDMFGACRGRFHSFRFRDWSDYSVAGQLLGTGGGSPLETEFQCVRTYTKGGQTYTKTVKLVDTDTLVVYFDGAVVNPGDYSIDNYGLITFSPAPGDGVAVTADFEFDLPVRFDIDQLQIAMETWEAGSAPSIPIVEVRDGEVVIS